MERQTYELYSNSGEGISYEGTEPKRSLAETLNGINGVLQGIELVLEGWLNLRETNARIKNSR